MATDDSSDLSSLSSLSPAPSEDEVEVLSDVEAPTKKSGILKFFPKLAGPPRKSPSPPPRKRSPSPPHEYVLADNSDIAFIIMFRSRFNDAFPKSLAHFGPQELERDISEPIPGDRAEHFLCAVLGLLLNRKQDVKPGHYGRALEDAISSHKGQWPREWEDRNPLSGGSSFTSMTPIQRLSLLRSLILWSMSASDALKVLITQSYKQNRHEDDLNQPRAVQAWGSDGDRRRYFLIEGQEDTNFRIYRESNPAGINRTWWSVAGSIEELQTLASKLETKDGGPKAKLLSHKMLQAVPRFEAGDEKRKRREYRQTQKERFKRPEPGFSMYEGRTRGKRVRYTFSDEEEVSQSDSTTRRSARNTGTTTPSDLPVTTMSGRQVRAPPRLQSNTGDDGGTSAQRSFSEQEDDGDARPAGRSRRLAASSTRSRRYDPLESEDEPSEEDFGDDEDDADVQAPAESDDEEDDSDEPGVISDEEEDLSDTQSRTLVVKLRVTPPHLQTALKPGDERNLNGFADPDRQKGDESAMKLRDIGQGLVGDDAASRVTVNGSSQLDESRQQEELSASERQNTTEQSRKLVEPVTMSASLAYRGSPEKFAPARLVSNINVAARE